MVLKILFTVAAIAVVLGIIVVYQRRNAGKPPGRGPRD